MKYKQGEPTVRNRASVLTTDITINFLEKHQLDELFPRLTSEGYSFYFECEPGDSVTHDKYSVTIESISWARNVKALFEFLETLDYNSGAEE